jgi:hypothetical protein
MRSCDRADCAGNAGRAVYHRFTSGGLRVYKSKRAYAAGEQLVLGGCGLSDFVEMPVSTLQGTGTAGGCRLGGLCLLSTTRVVLPWPAAALTLDPLCKQYACTCPTVHGRIQGRRRGQNQRRQGHHQQHWRSILRNGGTRFNTGSSSRGSRRVVFQGADHADAVPPTKRARLPACVV